MKIEAGKYYVERNGAIHGPILSRYLDAPDDPYVWEAGKYMWAVDGRFQYIEWLPGEPLDDPRDLVAEFVFPKVADAIAAERDACIEIAKSFATTNYFERRVDMAIKQTCSRIETAIRARGKGEKV